MQARSRQLDLAETSIASPLIIPSLSSKGFPIFEGISEVASVLELTHTAMTYAVLISAYDIHHRRLHDLDRLMSWPEYRRTPYATPALLVIDSGGYELAPDFESGEVDRSPIHPKEFTYRDFKDVVDRLPSEANIMVVSHDAPDRHRPSYREQCESAAEFFGERTHLRSDFLLKPEAGARFVDPGRVESVISCLRDFDVIGVTEKELGDSLLDRLVRLSRLRIAMDRAGISQPIHVFGGLDPLLTSLYFMCGAEVFDGLSWLKYAYIQDAATHPDAMAILKGQLDASGLRRNQLRHFANLKYLSEFQLRLRNWAAEPTRYEELGTHHAALRDIYETVQTEVRRGG